MAAALRKFERCFAIYKRSCKNFCLRVVLTIENCFNDDNNLNKIRYYTLKFSRSFNFNLFVLVYTSDEGNIWKEKSSLLATTLRTTYLRPQQSNSRIIKCTSKHITEYCSSFRRQHFSLNTFHGHLLIQRNDKGE